ncbi:MAG: hypothetical protein GEU90_10505 [Gemmatimonas sp.]|nr:hypothetical protein [Gemmatimonas sp.]
MKRSDQYRIDPAEAGATDYKNLPQTGRGHSNLDDTVRLDRKKEAESAAEAKRGPTPARVPPPSKDANRPIRESKVDRMLHPEPGAADSDSFKGDPLV